MRCFWVFDVFLKIFELLYFFFWYPNTFFSVAFQHFKINSCNFLTISVFLVFLLGIFWFVFRLSDFCVHFLVKIFSFDCEYSGTKFFFWPFHDFKFISFNFVIFLHFRYFFFVFRLSDFFFRALVIQNFFSSLWKFRHYNFFFFLPFHDFKFITFNYVIFFSFSVFLFCFHFIVNV